MNRLDANVKVGLRTALCTGQQAFVAQDGMSRKERLTYKRGRMEGSPSLIKVTSGFGTIFK